MAEIQGVKTKWWLIGGVGAVGVVWWVYKRKQASAAAAATSTQDPNIDPATGQPYSTEYSGSGSSPVGVTPSLYGYQDPFGNLITPGGGSVVTAPSTNAAWAQQAESYLTNQAGYDALTSAAALGKALGGIPLTNDEYTTVETAVGFIGQPPQGWPNGAPHQGPQTGQTGGGNLVVTGLKQVPGGFSGDVVLSWDPTPGAVAYKIVNGPGTPIATYATVVFPEFTSRFNKPGSSHTFTVQAVDATGKTGPVASVATVSQ